MTELKDKLGRVINVGDYIVYAHALGRCAALQFGKVLKIRTDIKSEWSHRPPESHITVIGCNSYHHFERPDKKWGLMSKAGTLMFPDRLIAIDGDQLPDNVRELLDGFVWKGGVK